MVASRSRQHEHTDGPIRPEQWHRKDRLGIDGAEAWSEDLRLLFDIGYMNDPTFDLGAPGDRVRHIDCSRGTEFPERHVSPQLLVSTLVGLVAAAPIRLDANDPAVIGAAQRHRLLDGCLEIWTGSFATVRRRPLSPGSLASGEREQMWTR
jgi:hypothetical protein